MGFKLPACDNNYCVPVGIMVNGFFHNIEIFFMSVGNSVFSFISERPVAIFYGLGLIVYKKVNRYINYRDPPQGAPYFQI